MTTGAGVEVTARIGVGVKLVVTGGLVMAASRGKVDKSKAAWRVDRWHLADLGNNLTSKKTSSHFVEPCQVTKSELRLGDCSRLDKVPQSAMKLFWKLNCFQDLQMFNTCLSLPYFYQIFSVRSRHQVL